MFLYAQHLALGRVLPFVRRLAAVLLLSLFSLTAIGSSARINGEMNAALQIQGGRTIAIVLLATPLVLALRPRRSTAQP